MFDYIEEYAKEYAKEYVANTLALSFWEDVSNVMDANRCSEKEALAILDPTGRKRAMYTRPADFPDCFRESA